MVLFLIVNIHHLKQTSMTPVGFEPTTSVDKWSQAYVLDHQLTMDSLILNRIQPHLRLCYISKVNNLLLSIYVYFPPVNVGFTTIFVLYDVIKSMFRFSISSGYKI